ncbi:hypothetical protein DPEC_G00044990 [Dallia pectoralis]|uniref:Uncharacterized protein n=1 Tax=Dallia pectoralis TaxID=75939 RepID=A0ACC2HA91_DALPE|nr:hypothetical protein DPEC_G00044990 [Dallia pectoralis]
MTNFVRTSRKVFSQGLLTILEHFGESGRILPRAQRMPSRGRAVLPLPRRLAVINRRTGKSGWMGGWSFPSGRRNGNQEKRKEKKMYPCLDACRTRRHWCSWLAALGGCPWTPAEIWGLELPGWLAYIPPTYSQPPLSPYPPSTHSPELPFLLPSLCFHLCSFRRRRPL